MAAEVNIYDIKIGRSNTKYLGIFTTDKGRVLKFQINYNRKTKKIIFTPRLKPKFLEEIIAEKLKPYF